ncbi:MAG: hypothetical protein R3250_17285 [Melioribacteraceae bacterium]|nr:hypothetical protein [Melioribacteraceae bacterium]
MNSKKNRFNQSLIIAYTFGKDNFRNEPLPEIAPLDFGYKLNGDFFNNQLESEFIFRYVLNQKRISEAFGETGIPAFSIIDLNIRYFYSRVLSIKIGVQIK